MATFPPEVLAHFARRHGVAAHHDGIVGTTRARTALDLSRHMASDLDLLSVIEQAMSDGRLSDAMKWAIEVDVFPTHAETAGRRSDGARDGAAASVGWAVTRIVEAQFGTRFDATVCELLDVYRQRLRTG